MRRLYRGERRGFVGVDPYRRRVSAAKEIGDASAEDPEQEGLECRLASKPGQALQQPDERLLHDIFRFRSVGQRTPRERQQPALVAGHQLLPRLPVSLTDLLQQVGFRCAQTDHGCIPDALCRSRPTQDRRCDSSDPPA